MLKVPAAYELPVQISVAHSSTVLDKEPADGMKINLIHTAHRLHDTASQHPHFEDRYFEYSTHLLMTV